MSDSYCYFFQEEICFLQWWVGVGVGGYFVINIGFRLVLELWE